MQYTGNYNLKKPEGTDVVNIDDLNDNADILDQKLKEVENKADSAPPNSVNDAAIGSRTPNQSQAPASPGTGTLTQLISWLANRIKAITGKTNWWEDPPTTLQAAKNHIDATAPHSGHETPSGAQEKANAALNSAKQYTDQEVAEVSQALDAHVAAAAPHSGHETPAGAQAKADAAQAAANAYTDQEVGDLAGEGRTTETVKGNADALDAHLAETVKDNVHGLKTTGNVTIYVDATSGNDANPGTQSQPLKTIGAAVGKITNLIIDNDHTVTIQLAPGTYVENVAIKNLHGAGAFYLRGGSNLAEADNYVIDGWVRVTGCTCITHIFGIKVLGSSNLAGVIFFNSCLAGRVTSCKIDKTERINSTNNYGIHVGTHSLVNVGHNDISNITGGSNINAAIQCFETSRVYSTNNTGSNNSIGLRASAGTIMKNGSQPSGTTAELALNGGVIR